MGANSKQYYFIDIRLDDMRIVKWGISETATLTGETDQENIHRIFLTKGQYNKLLKKLDEE